ncbi:YfbK domain-containing protein [Rubrivirga sp.]|uniref:YfbK domain-containing protein n=1 Tax=Rubrivirga sp. TaxID=1885344 RepID=UPI003C72BFC8
MLAFVAALSLLLAAPVPVVGPSPSTGVVSGTVTDAETGDPLVGANVLVVGLRGVGTATDIGGRYRLEVEPGRHTVRVAYVGYQAATAEVEVRAGAAVTLDLALEGHTLGEVVVEYERPMIQRDAVGAPMLTMSRGRGVAATVGGVANPMYRPPTDREGYAAVDEVGFKASLDAPLSTFSIDVDRASYSNARRFLTDGRLPPEDAVRVEEFVNSFDYGLDGPTGEHPFAVSTEITTAPWAPNHHLVRIGLQGERIDSDDLPPANLVFLIDVSGSMQSPDKLQLLQRAFRLLVREMRPQDKVALVVYAGASGVRLAPTSDKSAILEAIDDLRAGGSTGGAEGLRLAYQVARQNFDSEATNRVILATDGDFNVGESSDAEMQRLIEAERESGVFLSVLGFGTGNLQDSKMETLAGHGNGNYAYIDGIREAERVFVREFGGTLFAIAKDVKIQVEFNPARVAGYRLVGYENRALEAEDFRDDAKDAGELGAGHTVTALYEIVPVGVEVPTAGVDGLRYQATPALTAAAQSGEWMTVALRYKPALEAGTFSDESVGLEVAVAGEVVALGDATEATRWAVAVTEAALLLGASDYAPGASYSHALELAQGARGDDPHGDRAEFIRLVETARALTSSQGGTDRPVALGD